MLANRLASTLTALALAAPLTAAAATGDKPSFDKVDANGDGNVAIEEATKAGVPEKEAKREDIDGDGKLSQTDWKFLDMNPDEQSESSSS